MDCPLKDFEQFNCRGWDSYDASPILPTTVDKAREFLAMLPDRWQSPDAAPVCDGGIAFEWENGEIMFDIAETDNRPIENIVEEFLLVNSHEHQGL